ncbi:MAG: hypothetical protein EKK53_25225 [Burkholderiales bacterium]|nr:MAG: hypothetical protein EKK53_25225 [Burkholderiales bacterium]
MLSRLLQSIQGKYSPLSRAASAFRPYRLDYYVALADRLEGAVSGRGGSLASLFERDAERYAGTPRGVLSAHWADQYLNAGATIADAWSGTLPDDEVACIAVAEENGNAAVITALRDLARVGNVIAKAKKEFISTAGVALVGAFIAFAIVLAMPYFFKPGLLKSFSGVSPQYFGAMTRNYFAVSDGIARWWLPVVIAVAAAVWWVIWALPNWIGPLRSTFDDKFFVFQLHRQYRGAMFLATFASLTKSKAGEGDGSVTSQRDALVALEQRAVPWVSWKIRQMVEHIDAEGLYDASALDVGIVDKDMYYLIADVYDSKGIAAGLTVAGLRTEQQATETIARRAKVIRFLLLGMCVAIVLAVNTWQQLVVRDLSRAMQTQFTSGG